VRVDIEGPYPIRASDTYLLCSDGLTNLVNDEEIGIVGRELPPVEACQLLVDLANVRGGSDNITVVVVRVGDVPPGLPPDVPLEGPHAEAGYGWGWLAAIFLVGIAFILGNT